MADSPPNANVLDYVSFFIFIFSFLLPMPGSGLQATFASPYGVKKKLSETDYVISTPDGKSKSRVCHVNMLSYTLRLCKEKLPV